MNASQQLSAQWQELRSQWAASARLRWGVWAVLLILVLYGMQLALDHVDLQRERIKTLDAELTRMRSLSGERAWADRAKEAEQLKIAMTTMAWNDNDLGLTEAALQDWLRNMASRLGLKTRDLTIVRVEAGKGQDPVAASALPAVPSGYAVLRARMSIELQRAPLMAFLGECTRSERAVVVERLALRMQGPVPMAEVDLRVLARNAKAGT
ncbi:hypothetical protein [Pelomonas sp. SE-A7]|uniref:hypothetical protein n=1 Tax=Pelomonas sp. SE-A7 TaxID=3054953 RepID=UPI00259C8DE9|nr:hypothetical protein [Pelomonas sp. SE-A7]MDM4767541.1 hypothetical protein [Pelomonas sp. SE-A7]